MKKYYQEPEFQVIRKDAANAVFFAGSEPEPTLKAFNSTVPAATLNVSSTNGWF